MDIHKNFQLRDKFTWHVDSIAKYYAIIQNEADVKTLIHSSEYTESNKHYILGRGANTLFASGEYDGMVIEIDTKGCTKEREDDEYEYWRIASGEDWIELVHRMVVDQNLGGLENLGYIPGKVGSAPIQNIAAYGQSFEDICEEVEIVDLTTLRHKTYSHDECHFGYRNSIFKKMLIETNHGFVVWSVVLKLSKPIKHTIEAGYFSNYESLQSQLSRLHGASPTIKDIYMAVVTLRKQKLPEIAEYGSNGSLFVNPIVSGNKVTELLGKFPLLQYYPAEKMKYIKKDEMRIEGDKEYKIAAGHIFDSIGWKGKRVGLVGTWKNHALVLCNYGTNKPEDIIRVIEMMQDDFARETGIRLEPEINIVK